MTNRGFPFRMRIRDLVAHRTVFESFDDKPEVVAKAICVHWALHHRRDQHEWIVQVHSRTSGLWRDLTHKEHALMEGLLSRYTSA